MQSQCAPEQQYAAANFCCPLDRFITYEDEEAIEKVFAKGRMHELAGKNVEVKRATPKGTGPTLGRGQGWRSYEARPEGGALEPPGMRSQPQGWSGYASPGMMSYGIASYQVLLLSLALHRRPHANVCIHVAHVHPTFHMRLLDGGAYSRVSARLPDDLLQCAMQMPYADAYGAYGGRHLQQMGAYRHGGYQYIIHPMHSQGRGG